MSYPQAVKDIAYTLDPECWVSYAGKPRAHKSYMDGRRSAALAKAQRRYVPPEPECCPCCGRPLTED